MPLRDLVAVVHMSLVMLVLVPLAIHARRRPDLRRVLVVIAALVAVFVASRAFFGALFGWRFHLGVVSGEFVDPEQRESILAAAVADSRPLLAFGAAAVVVLLGWCIANVERRRAVWVAGALALLAPLAWSGLRDRGLHEDLVRAELARVPAGTSLESCLELEGAAEYANDFALVERLAPDARARAKDCISFELRALDAEDADGRRLVSRAALWEQVNPGHGHRTALDHLRASPLLVDPAQRAEVVRRATLAAR